MLSKRNHVFKQILIFLLVLTAVCACAFTVSAAKNTVVTNTLDISQAKKNMVGPGYNWQNRYDILELDNLYLETTDDYGLRLPKYCTVILSGVNYIKANKYALSCAGTVTFKGSGKLILDAGEIGMFLYSEDSKQKIRLLDGSYEIHGGEFGIFSTASDFSFVDGSMKITVDNADGAAISGRIVHLLGGELSANNAVESSHILEVRGVNLDISGTKAAFAAPSLSISDIALSADNVELAEYNGEAVIKGISTYKPIRTSIIFGEDVNGIVDYICLTVLLMGFAAAIVIPVIHHKKKARKLIERLSVENPDAAAILKK